MLSERDIRLACVAALFAAIGAMIGLTIAVLIFPPPATISGGHPIILDSQVAQVRFEPREKAFFVLAVILSGITGLIGSFGSVYFKCRIWLLLICLVFNVLTFNYVADKALNSPEGLYWGLSGIAISSLMVLCAALGARFETPFRS